MILFIYHSFCRDGTAAASVAAKFEEQCKERMIFLAVKPEELTSVLLALEKSDTKIYILDCGISLYQFNLLKSKTNKYVIIDHHDSHAAYAEHLQNPFGDFVYCKNKCAAMLTWEYCFPRARIPLLLHYLQDMDLWTTTMIDSRAIIAGLQHHLRFEFERTNSKVRGCSSIARPLEINPNTPAPNFMNWYKFMNDSAAVIQCKEIGEVILAEHQKELIKAMRTTHRAMWHDTDTLFCNYSGSLKASELADFLFEKCKCEVVFIWWFNSKTQTAQVSLRSQKVNVAAIAQQHSGGGHDGASGFVCSLEQLVSIIA